MSVKSYVDAVAQGLEFIEPNQTKHPDSFGKEGQAYFCIEQNMVYVKAEGSWVPLSSGMTFQDFLFYWCSFCHKKIASFDKKDLCDYCENRLIPLDITEEIFNELPEYCTKGDIVEASIGKIGGL